MENMVLLMGNFKCITKTNDEKFPYKLTIKVKRKFKGVDNTYSYDEFNVFVAKWWFNIEEVIQNLEKENLIYVKCHLWYIEDKMELVLDKIILGGM